MKACYGMSEQLLFMYEGAKPPTPLFASKYAATPDAGTAPRNAPPEFCSEIPYKKYSKTLYWHKLCKIVLDS
jgi:hypothetical protein